MATKKPASDTKSKNAVQPATVTLKHLAAELGSAP